MRWFLLLTVGCAAACSAASTSPRSTSAPQVASAAPIATATAEPGAVAPAPPPVASGSAAPAVASAAPPAPQPPRPRIGSIGKITWIYAGAARNGGPIGYIRPGTAVTLRNTEPVRGQDCSSNRWMPVEPRGFVCNDGTTTLDLDSEPYKALAALQPDRTSAFPFKYAYSTGAPMYGRLPTAEQQNKTERAWRPVSNIPRNTRPHSGHEELAGWDAIPGPDPAPYFVSQKELPRMPGQRAGLLRWEIPEGQMLSYRTAFEHDGRVFLASPDLTLVPADRMRPFKPSTFKGVALGGDVKLPIAWVRHAPKTKYRRADDGSIVKTADSWPARAWVALTGQKEPRGADVFLETREQGVYIRQADASVVEAPPQAPFSVEASEKWIDVDLSDGNAHVVRGGTPRSSAP